MCAGIAFLIFLDESGFPCVFIRDQVLILFTTNPSRKRKRRGTITKTKTINAAKPNPFPPHISVIPAMITPIMNKIMAVRHPSLILDINILFS